MTEERREVADQIAKFIEDHKGIDVTVIDVSEDCSWADCFIIATVNSVGHLKGVAHELWGELKRLGVDVNNRHKNPSSDGWELIDGGDVIIHLMSAEFREFYALEKLWQKPNR